MAAVDASPYAPSVAEHAGWAASRLSAGLELLHAIDRVSEAATRDLSGSLSLGTQEALLAELSVLDERRAKLAQEHGRTLLEGLRERITATHGVRAEVRQRHGSVLESLLDSEAEVRLFVVGKRGEHADFAKGHLGSNLERVVRAVHRPVLVASRAFKPIRRFMVAFDGSATTRKCVEMVCASPLLKGLACELLMVGENDAAHQGHLQWAQARLQEAGFEPAARIVAGAADTVIPQQVEEYAIDLLVMGAYGHSRIRTMIVGSTTTQVLRTCQIPVLLLR
ncbi:universal stress protein UspA [Pseudoxanthomonas wuyuanensis]|nr:universal stress protein UspA [Pseudoxanthomonas wuyuanensis]